ncbi:MAG: hypothetical protein ACRDHM_11850 [Actinomycetota bacterium]
MEAVCNPDGELGVDALDGVASLVDQGLVRGTSASGDPRFDMLEIIRAFAAERLAEAERDEIRRRHAGYFLSLVEQAEPRFVGADDALWLGRLERTTAFGRPAMGDRGRSGRPRAPHGCLHLEVLAPPRASQKELATQIHR